MNHLEELIDRTDRLEELIGRMDRLEELILSVAESETDKRLTDKKAVKSKSSAMTASDTVLEVIKKFEDGASFAEIKSRTGFEEKKLRNIIFRLNNTGKIKRKERGIYVAS